MSRLQEACKEKGPLCIGLDTDPSYLPPEVLSKYSSPAKAVLAYNKALIRATHRYTACYKVQIAYYEAMGLEGLKCYCETLKAIKAKNVPVISVRQKEEAEKVLDLAKNEAEIKRANMAIAKAMARLKAASKK